MAPLLIKICGVKSPQILDHSIAQGADMAGFVHFEKSPRHIALEAITALAQKARGQIETTVLLVDPDDALVERAAATGVDWLQLHGHETPERLADIKTRSGKKVMKALPIGTSEDIAAIAPFAAAADRLILDARPPRGATRPGGLGAVFDWSLLEALDPSTRFMLSGGLHIDNVTRAVRTVRPLGLDVSSGVEREKGVKDMALITAFIACARAASCNEEQAK